MQVFLQCRGSMAVFECNSNPIIVIESQVLIGEASLEVEQEKQSNKVAALSSIIASYRNIKGASIFCPYLSAPGDDLLPGILKDGHFNI